jgi:hypothetical protein
LYFLILPPNDNSNNPNHIHQTKTAFNKLIVAIS